MKTESKFKRDEIYTIAEIRKRMEPHPPHRDAFHKAVKRGKLKKLEKLSPDGDIQFLGGDLLDYMDSGGFKNHSPLQAGTSDVDASPELIEGASPISAAINTSTLAVATETHADSELIEVVSVEITPGQGTTSELSEVEELLIELPNLTEDDCIQRIAFYWNRAKDYAINAMEVGARALSSAWACGTLLNKVKADCPHGKFTPWLKMHLEPMGISTRTGQRYMKLAEAWRTVDEVVVSQSGLKEAYVTCGIIHESGSPPIDVKENSGGDTAQASDKPRSTKPLLACATTLQKRLRHFTETGEVLAQEDLNQLGEVIDELTNCYKQLQH